MEHRGTNAVRLLLRCWNAENTSLEFQYFSPRKGSLQQYEYYTVMGTKLQNECVHMKKETIRQSDYTAIATEHSGSEIVIHKES
jgi:hypothetical protein